MGLVLSKRRMIVTLRRQPSSLLLAAQLLAVLIYPFLDNSDAGRVAYVLFCNVVLALALWVVNRNPFVNWIGWVLAIPAVICSVVGHLGKHPSFLTVGYSLEALLYFYTAVGLIFYMLGDQSVTFDELVAAGATFTLLAWSFAFAFLVCQAWVPGSFTASQNTQDPRSWLELLFLSFATLSGVGLSDIIPIRSFARSLVMLEMFCGVMYLAIVVSRLIALATIRAKQGK
ncbi:ion channel [Roseimicrobium gellanilyticum]|uniref:Ion channel n=1 Tax=Roseimicrobium gellanilyticum TaxID=748857 RepID=A0A366HBQ8_9BACT|nr:ion channel [Roseimicrobium gellanilyticum]RBP39746.1 ion channel [Roseimicrobium gellanilyticum]